MKNLPAFGFLALALIGSSALQAHAQDSQLQITQDKHYKVKVKDDRIIARDKSKPVRRALEEQYAKLAEANRIKDLAAVLALRTPDFSAQVANGEIRNSEEMAAYHNSDPRVAAKRANPGLCAITASR
jgi:hypothetical protein